MGIIAARDIRLMLHLFYILKGRGVHLSFAEEDMIKKVDVSPMWNY